MTNVKTLKVHELSDRFFWLAALLVVGVVLYLLIGLVYQFDNLPKNNPQQLSVSGEGKTYVKPDIALVTFGVNTQGLQSQDVVDGNNTTMNAVIAAIKKLGVADGDIQTTMYSLNPTYSYSDKGVQVFNGYSLNQQVSVKIRNFDNISAILDAATSNGANTVGSLQFTVDDPIKAEAAARAQAIAQAKEKAQDMIAGTGLQIDKLLNISEDSSSVPQPIYNGAMSMMAAVPSVAPQIQTGQMEIDSNVTLTYLLK